MDQVIVIGLLAVVMLWGISTTLVAAQRQSAVDDQSSANWGRELRTHLQLNGIKVRLFQRRDESGAAVLTAVFYRDVKVLRVRVLKPIFPNHPVLKQAEYQARMIIVNELTPPDEIEPSPETAVTTR